MPNYLNLPINVDYWMVSANPQKYAVLMERCGFYTLDADIEKLVQLKTKYFYSYHTNETKNAFDILEDLIVLSLLNVGLLYQHAFRLSNDIVQSVADEIDLQPQLPKCMIDLTALELTWPDSLEVGLIHSLVCRLIAEWLIWCQEIRS